MSKNHQRDLFVWQWPPAAQYPLNNEEGTVGVRIREDLKASEVFLILTGFSSLDYLIDEIGDEEIWRDRSISVVLGNEPVIREELRKKRLTKKKNTFTHHIADYWLQKGISIKLNGPLLSFIRGIEEQKIDFRIHSRLHGKVYLGDHHLVMGSSNFSYSGMKHQAEINVRYGKDQTEYAELKGIAEHYHSESKDYNEELLILLGKLLQLVEWEEALARAVAELLEGDWVERYLKDLNPGQEFSLWPTQRQAIGQALYILDNEGSVLIAEPTGSGKTRVGAHLLAALLNRFWQQGRGNRSKYKIVAPPLVLVNWQEELDQLYFTVAKPISHGILSHLTSLKNQSHRKDIRDANVLLIDESHNYLNIKSNRTQSIKNNKADHVILFTATPINRKWNDLLRMVELLGLDYLSDDAYKAYKKLRRVRSGSKPGGEIIGQLRSYSQKFIVRRTKWEINEIIDKDPESFVDQFGNRCRFPKHVCNIYPVNQHDKDIELGNEINRLSNELSGVLFLKIIHLTKEQINEGVNPKDFVNGRLKAAKALSKYNIKNCLRSSRAALIEHILGTREAGNWAGIGKLRKSDTGNILSSLEGIDDLPTVRNIDKSDVPEWLTDKETYFKTVNRELQILIEIAGLTKKMSDRREHSKAKFLAGLIRKQSHILAFDSIIITQYVLNRLLTEYISNDTELMIATGDNSDRGKEKIQQYFHPSTDSSSVIGLCTDALSEGVNLQKASAVVFLDMPTVIRKAEQRAGRVDRLDSPHKKIDIYWPEDHKVFQLEADKKFIERHDLVDSVIGANIELPDEISSNHMNRIDPETMKELYEDRQKEDREWKGVDDAFKPVRKFVNENGLIDPGVYEQIKNVTARVLSRVSIVTSNESWGFFALRGTEKRAPKWVLIKTENELVRDLPEICSFLEKKLPRCSSVTTRLKSADAFITGMIDQLNDSQKELLPNKKRLALTIFEDLIRGWHKKERKSGNNDKELLKIYQHFLELFQRRYKQEGYSIDCYEFSQRLLDLLQPYFSKAEAAQTSRRSKNINSLRDLKKWLKNNPVKKEDLESLWNDLPADESLDKQIAAAIIAIPEGIKSYSEK